MREAVVRPAARVVIVDANGWILLQKIATTEGWEGWITPGGALEDGETPEQAAVREVVEEVGVRDITLRGPIWTRRHVFDWNGERFDQRETFFFAELNERVEPVSTVGPELLIGVVDHRWWSLDELERSDVVVVPRDLVALVRGLLVDGLPRDPIEVGV